MRTERTTDICLEIGNLIEGYAVGALDADEMLHVATAIAECPNEQQRLIQYEETVGLIGLAARSIEPPAELWRRLQASTRDVADSEPIDISSRRRGGIVVPPWVAGLLSAAAVLLLVTSISLGVALRRSNDANGEMFDSTMATYLTSGGAVIPLASLSTPDYLGWAGRGSLLVAPDMAPMVIVDKCVPSSNGYAYVVWLQSGEQRTPMGNIEINEEGRGMMKLEGIASLDNYDVLGISIRTSSDKVYDVITGAPSDVN
jgi:hypothetical protein